MKTTLRAVRCKYCVIYKVFIIKVCNHLYVCAYYCTIVFEDFGNVSQRFFAQSLTLKKQIFFLISLLNVTSSIIVVEGVRRCSTVHLACEGNKIIKAQPFFGCRRIESTTPGPLHLAPFSREPVKAGSVCCAGIFKQSIFGG